MFTAFGRLISGLRAVPRDDERRLHERALSRWHKLKSKGAPVPLDGFAWQSVEDHRVHGFLLDARDAPAPRFIHIGPVLQDEAGLKNRTEAGFEDIKEGSLLARFSKKFDQALVEGDPVTDSHEFLTPIGYRVLTRGVLLPLSSDGLVNDHVYGVISWKSERVETPE